MNWASIGEGAIGAGIGMIGSALSQRQNYKYSKKLMELQYQQNLDLWNKQNEYNSPTAQMQRLQAAGLNPNLVYGSSVAGNSSNNTSTSLGSVSPVDYTDSMFKGVSAVTNMKLARSTVRRQETQNQLDLALAANKALDTQYLRETLNSRVSYQNELTKFSLQQWPLILQQQKNVITIQGKDIDLKMQEYYNAQLEGKRIAAQTKLTNKEADKLALEIEAFPQYLDNLRSQTYANRVNANANAVNAAANKKNADTNRFLARSTAKRNDFLNALTKIDTAIKKGLKPYEIDKAKWDSLSAGTQYNIIKLYGFEKARLENKKLYRDAFGADGGFLGLGTGLTSIGMNADEVLNNIIEFFKSL